MTWKIEKFVETIKHSGDFDAAFRASQTPKEAWDFVNFTFDVIKTNKDYLQASIFTFRREDLIPGMFISLVNDLHNNFPNDISNFKYYLERHIEVDGDHNSALALQMTAGLCGNNAQLWEEALQITIESLKKRKQLWDGAYEQIMAKKSKTEKELLNI